MANTRSYNAVGSGDTPRLGTKSFVSGLARPAHGGAHSERVTPGAGSVSSVNGKVHRPGGRAHKVARAAGTSPKVARPGWREKV